MLSTEMVLSYSAHSFLRLKKTTQTPKPPTKFGGDRAAESVRRRRQVIDPKLTSQRVISQHQHPTVGRFHRLVDDPKQALVYLFGGDGLRVMRLGALRPKKRPPQYLPVSEVVIAHVHFFSLEDRSMRK